MEQVPLWTLTSLGPTLKVLLLVLIAAIGIAARQLHQSALRG